MAGRKPKPTALALLNDPSAGVPSGTTLKYALGNNGTTAPTSGWATDIPTGTNAGT